MFSRLSTSRLSGAFLTAKRSAGLSPATLESYEYHLGHFAERCPKLPRSPEPIEAFLVSIPGSRYRWNHYVTLRTFYRWLVKRRRLRNPIPSVERPRLESPVPVYLEDEELGRLLNHPGHPDRDRALLWLLADNGMRIGEAHSITPSSAKNGLVLVDGKMGPRPVPLSPIVAQMLADLISSANGPADETIWRGRDGALTIDGLKAVVRRAFRRAGFQGPKMSAHCLRHTFATLWEGQEAEGRAIGGWKTGEMWQRYHHLRMSRLIEQHRRFSPIVRIITH